MTKTEKELKKERKKLIENRPNLEPPEVRSTSKNIKSCIR